MNCRATAVLSLLLASVAGCAAPPKPTRPLVVAPEAATPDRQDTRPFAVIPGEEPPAMRAPPYLPAPQGLPPAAPAPLVASPTPPPGGFAPGLPPGPVTNYGTGGMQQMPGAPPNPPYPPGGLMR